MYDMYRKTGLKNLYLLFSLYIFNFEDLELTTAVHEKLGYKCHSASTIYV